MQRSGLTCTEWHDTSPEIARVEGHIDAGKWDRSKATLESDISLLSLLFLRLRVARVDDLAEHLLHLVDGELLGQL